MEDVDRMPQEQNFEEARIRLSGATASDGNESDASSEEFWESPAETDDDEHDYDEHEEPGEEQQDHEEVNLEQQNGNVPVQEELVGEDEPVGRRFDRPNRGVPPERYGSIRVAVGSGGEPRTYAEAVSSVESTEWKAAMEEEMASHRENGTWELTQLPPDRRAVGCKWVYKRKEDENGKVARFKARLVAQGFSQRYGCDYDQVFAPVMKQTTLRTVLTFASKNQMLVRHVDIKTAYLYGELQEELYMKQPPGYGTGDPTIVCRLRKTCMV